MNPFELAYSQLNKAQKQAVDTIYGPVVVIAGPGTGKTQLLTLRIANILAKTDASPRNILALTYTEAGSFAMRDRLRSFIGTDSLRVNIETFHSFCKGLIDEEYPEKFVRSPGMKMLEELDARRMVAKILLDGEYTYLKPRHDPELYMGDVIRIVGQLKREGITPEFFRNKIDEAIVELPNNPELHYQRDSKWGKKGERKADYVDTEQRLQRQRELTYVYRAYEEALKTESRYDYDDMILMVRDRLQSDESFGALIREQYQFILVDEFQDTNGLQASIVDLIMKGQEQPNILVVGDDEQSIYRFQGAVMENIINFCDTYKNKGLTIIPLIENYRSTQTILDASRGLIRNNSESLEKALNLDKHLNKNTSFDENKIRLFTPTDAQLEIAGIAEQIKKFHEQGVAWNEMAIIYRKNSNPIHLIEYFRREKIPFHKQKGENLLHHPEAQKLMKTLKIIDNSYQNELFWEVMLFDFWGLDLHYLLSLQGKMKASNGEYRRSLFQAFLEDDDMFVRSIATKIMDFTQSAANKTLVQFFESFLEISGYRSFALNQEDKIERLSILNSFFDEIKTFSSLHPESTLKEFINYITDLDHYGLSPTTQPIRMESNAVELMTAHGSKGLEFEVVFIYDATGKNWESSRDPSKLNVTVSLFEKHLIDKSEKKNQKLEEERRLWYVAMTRAKKHLIVSATDNEDARLKPSAFISEMPDNFVEKVEINIDPEKVIIAQTAVLPPINWSEATRTELEKRVKNYDLSVTALNTWLKSPREFLEKYLIRQPAGKMPSASFGTAVHAGLAFIGEYYNEHNSLPSQELWLEKVEQTLYHEILTKKEQSDFFAKTKDVIVTYLSRKDCPLAAKALVEERFGWKKVVVAGVRLTGVFDRVETLPDGTMQVVDFKTGKPDKGKEQLEDYERQLYFYRLLWDGSGQYKTLSCGALDFVENNPLETVNRKIYTYEEAGLELLRKQIAAFKVSLESLDFPEKNTFFS
ncbi:ATP-dependent helicase [Candidatus Gracilibacteria bacterium]|nr:ATP-dependent helicase [Candidatus Gracilibacteria bacterium]